MHPEAANQVSNLSAGLKHKVRMSEAQSRINLDIAALAHLLWSSNFALPHKEAERRPGLRS